MGLVILTRHRLGPKLTPKEAAKELRVDKKMVGHWLGVYDEQRERRPRATTAGEDRKLVDFAEAHDKASSAVIAQRLQGRHVEVTACTVRRRLGEAGLEHLGFLYKPLLSRRSRKARLE